MVDAAIQAAMINKTCTPEKGDRTLDIILGCICLLLSLLASVGNLASLIYVKLNWNVGNKRKANYTHQMTLILVVNIALTDLLNGMFSASFNAANLFKDQYPMPEPQLMFYLCNFCGLIHFLTTRASILLMMCLSVFRYIAITKPTLFNHKICLKVLWSVLGAVWLFTIAISFLPYYLNTRYIYWADVSHCTFHYWQLKDGLTDLCEFLRRGAQELAKSIFFSLYILPIHGPGFTMIIFTMLILIRLGKLHIKVQKGKGPTSKKQRWIDFFRRSSEESLHAKAAYSTLQILAFFVLTYGPWWIISLIHYLDMNSLVKSEKCKSGQFWRCHLGRKYFSLMLFISMYLMVYLNAAINPFIYYYRLFKRSEAIKRAHYSRGTSVANGGLTRGGSRDFLNRDLGNRSSNSPPHDYGEHPKQPLVTRGGSNNSNHRGDDIKGKNNVGSHNEFALKQAANRHTTVYTSSC